MARDRLVIDGLEHLNIRWRFRVVVIAFGLAFLAYIVWSATEQAAIEKGHVREQALALARATATRLDDQVEQMDRILATAAHSIGANIDDSATASTLLQAMRSNVPAAVNNIAVWSITGRNIASLDRATVTQGYEISDRRYFRDAIRFRGLAIEAPIVSRGNGELVAQFARPIFDGNHQLVGVISMSTRLYDLIGQLDPTHRLTNDSLVTVLDRDGTILARSADPVSWVGKQVPQLDRLSDAFDRKDGARELTGIDGQIRLSGFSVASKVPWIVYVGEPIEMAIAPVSERLLTNLALGFAILALALLLAGRIASWTITPLLRLAADTEKLGAGDLGHRSEVTTGAEIATLATNFNRMAAALEEREKQLEASRRQMRDIADHMPAQITYIDADERYRFVNSYVGRIAKLPAHEMIGQTVRDVRGDEVYQEVAPYIYRALAGEATTVEISGIGDGGRYHFRVDYVPDRDGEGEVRGLYAFTQDITERRTAELLRAESEKRLVTITNNLPAMICYIDSTKRFQFANRAFEKWFDRPLSDVVGRSFTELMSADVAAQFDAHFDRGMKGETREYELEVPIPGKRNRWLRSTFIPDVDEATGEVVGVYGMIHNVTAAKEAEQRLTRLAQFDTLTGLPNRHQFNEKLAHAMAARDTSAPQALMFLDIDHFKQVNDRYGHADGDALLKEFAQRLAQCVRPTDTVARLSGDEFVVLLAGLHSEEEPRFIARKIIATVQKPFLIDDRFLQVTSSIGIAMISSDHETPSVLMKRADEALYEAKHAGRNTFRMAS